MAGVRLYMLKSLRKSTGCSLNPQFQSYSSYGKFVNYTDPGHIRPAYSFINRSYHSKETQSHKTFAKTYSRALGSEPFLNNQSYRTKPISAFSPSLSRSQMRGVGVPAASSGSEVDVGNSGIVGSDWVGKFKDAWQCAVDAATYTGQKAKETSTEQSPYIQQLLDSNPHLRNVVVPVGCTLQYLAPAWRGAVILSFVWFLHRWKTNVFTHALATQSLPGLDRDKLLAMDNISSVGLFVIGIMALAEACGVAVQSIMTVGGIGGED
ncbi:hypothetical protein ACFX2I_000682 [Malus domestica]